MQDRIAAIAERDGVTPEDIARAADEIAEHFAITPDEALDAMDGSVPCRVDRPAA